MTFTVEYEQEEGFGLLLMDWDEWLGMEIEAETLEKYSELDILCHCFWEMTWVAIPWKRLKNSGKSYYLRLIAIAKNGFVL